MKYWFVLGVSALLSGAVMAAEEKQSYCSGKTSRMEAMDTDKDQKVTLDEFLAHQKAIAEKQEREYKEKASRRLFTRWDKNKDSVLTIDEIDCKKCAECKKKAEEAESED